MKVLLIFHLCDGRRRWSISGVATVKSNFLSKYGMTLALLERELKCLWAKDVVIQAGFSAVRNDGWPYSNARPDHPAVILQFRSRGELLSFRAVRYRTFEDNLRAIALSLEALRAVDRCGVVEGQQYAGFKQLAAAATDLYEYSKREAAIRDLRDRATTDGERTAAQAALDRLRRKV